MTPTNIYVSALERQAIGNALDRGDEEFATDTVQELAAAYGLDALPGGAKYGIDVDTGELLAP